MDIAPYAKAIELGMYVVGAGLVLFAAFRIIKIIRDSERLKHVESHAKGREKAEREEEDWDDSGGLRGAAGRGRLRDDGDS